MRLPAEDFFDTETDDATAGQDVARNATPLALLILLKPVGWQSSDIGHGLARIENLARIFHEDEAVTACMPPNFDRHGQHVAGLTPCWRATFATVIPLSASFKIAAI
jgi:hypothetical protein